MMLSFGPLVWATTSPVTVTPASALASLVTSVPSTTSSAGRLMLAPASPVSFSTSTTSPTATLYCLPPVLTMAYTVGLLVAGQGVAGTSQRTATCRGYRTPRAPSNACYTLTVGGPAGRLVARRRRLGAASATGSAPLAAAAGSGTTGWSSSSVGGCSAISGGASGKGTWSSAGAVSTDDTSASTAAPSEAAPSARPPRPRPPRLRFFGPVLSPSSADAAGLSSR